MNDEQAVIVLVVDDNPINLGLLFDTLRQAEYKTLIAQDGAGAIKQAAKLKPDIILLDIDMPGLDGFETCRRFKSNPKTADIPIIFLTNYAGTVDKVRGFDVGGVDYLTKPVDPAEVLARLNTHLTICNLQRQLEIKNKQLRAEAQEYAANLQVEIEKRRLYQRERYDLLQNVSQQNESLQQLASQVMVDHRQQNQLLGQTLQNEVASDLDLLQEILRTTGQRLANTDMELSSSLSQLDSALVLVDQIRQNLQRVIARLAPLSSEEASWQNPLSTLSNREREVLRLVAQGKTNQEIAAILSISSPTVGVYRWRGMQKLKVDNVPDLVKLAIKYHLVDLSG